MGYKYLDYAELDDSEVKGECREGEEEREERLNTMIRNLCSIITELEQELNDLFEDLLKE